MRDAGGKSRPKGALAELGAQFRIRKSPVGSKLDNVVRREAACSEPNTVGASP